MYEIEKAILHIVRCSLALFNNNDKNPEVIIIFTKWMMSIECYLSWNSLKLHLLHIINASKGVELRRFCETMFPKYY